MAFGDARGFKARGRPVVELGGGREPIIIDVSDPAPRILTPALNHGNDTADLAHQKTCLIDVMRTEIAGRTPAGCARAVAPRKAAVRFLRFE